MKMKRQNKTLNKINQAGSMMIEALAMLTLISLVTPTLYKKSAERTTELQDINAATHARTLMKAVDNYTSTNYPTLLETIKQNESSNSLSLSLDQIADYLPYGYNTDSPIKNFDKPSILIQQQGNSDSLTAFVVFPKQGDITDLRASRIASMIGANGGYIDKEGKAKGVGGIWSLDKNSVKAICDKCDTNGSIITISNDSINNASRTSFENTKYLQRTAPEDPNDKWRNTMLTDLYMGGVQNELDQNVGYNSIYGVNRLILNGTNANTSQTDDLVINASSTDVNSGSAFVKGSLKALDNKFSVQFVTSGDDVTPQLNFAGFLNATDSELTVGNVDKNGTPTPAFKLAPNEGVAELNVDTAIDGKLSSTGDTSLASNDGTTFKVGPSGGIITADSSNVKMHGDAFNLTSGENSDLTVDTKTVNLKGTTTVGDKESPLVASATYPGLDPQLIVRNDAFVKGTMEAGKVAAHDFDTLSLHAGAENFSDGTRWLNVDNSGVVVEDKNGRERLKVDAEAIEAKDKDGATRLIINNSSGSPHGSYLLGPQFNDDGSIYQGQVFIGDTDAGLVGVREAYVQTTASNGFVSVQDGAIKAQKHWDSTKTNIDNTVSVNALSTDVNADQFVVQDHSGKKLLNVVSGERSKNLTNDSTLEVDPNAINVWATRDATTNEYLPANQHVLQVDASSAQAKTGATNSNASVYIRRGAIELEGSKAPATGGATYLANQGVGYIEASRFVDNSLDSDGVPLEPVLTKDTMHGSVDYYYDRYMVNPAYTSVMHDIKLTTRGGARLSDILPDFINKGIYIVNNTYADGVNFNNLNVSVVNGQVKATNASELTNLKYGEQWASPYMGMVPAPLCPPGHASVITLTPASFQMAQAGELVKNSGSNGRYYVEEGENANKFLSGATGDRITTSEPLKRTITIGTNPETGAYDQADIYYLGLSDNPGTFSGTEILKSPKPLYFQQSTWLKSKVIAYNSSGVCDGQSGMGCNDFLGWATVMGFIYPESMYGDAISALTGATLVNDSSDKIYWNIFPVRALSMEAYATVYCYFDRTNIFNSGNQSEYVDGYDQMNNFRSLNSKSGSASNYGGGSAQYGGNTGYIKRLNDPHLKYSDPW